MIKKDIEKIIGKSNIIKIVNFGKTCFVHRKCENENCNKKQIFGIKDNEVVFYSHLINI